MKMSVQFNMMTMLEQTNDDTDVSETNKVN